MSMHGANGKGKRKQKGHLAFQVPFLHVLARSHENGTNGGLTVKRTTNVKKSPGLRQERGIFQCWSDRRLLLLVLIEADRDEDAASIALYEEKHLVLAAGLLKIFSALYQLAVGAHDDVARSEAD